MLLDPYLTKLSDKGYPIASRYFDQVMASTLNILQGKNIGDYWIQRRFILRAVKVGGGETVWGFVKDFLDETMDSDADYEEDSEGDD